MIVRVFKVVWVILDLVVLLVCLIILKMLFMKICRVGLIWGIGYWVMVVVVLRERRRILVVGE